MTLVTDAPAKPALPVPDGLTVYGKDRCVQCTATTRNLDGSGTDYTYISLLDDEDALMAFKGNGLTQAPIIQFPEVRDSAGDVLFEATTATGYRVDLLESFKSALAAV